MNGKDANSRHLAASIWSKSPNTSSTASSNSSDAGDISSEQSKIHNQHAAIQQSQHEKPKAFGNGLKRALENESHEQPVSNKRQKSLFQKAYRNDGSELSWEGFSSTDGSDREIDLLDGSADEDSKSENDPQSDDSLASGTRDLDDLRDRKARSSAFKAWATEQVNETNQFTPIPSTAQSAKSHTQLQKGLPSRRSEDTILPQQLGIPKAPDRNIFSVAIERPETIQEARLKLPAVAEEQKIMEAIFSNTVTVICGATGSGKTTQIPQFLYEAGFGNPESENPGTVGITQPRRVAAVSMAKRVAEELGGLVNEVSYQIRFDSTVGHKTALKFMTDGILVREISQDFSLSKYSIIIIDEAHERSSSTDILMGMVSRIVDLRDTMAKEDKMIKPLKLIVMSATLRMSDFLDNQMLFPRAKPPLLQIEGRQHPVTIHFARQTKRDYVDEAFYKVCKGHRRLPPGGILVFLTGQNEIDHLSRRLKGELQGGQTSVQSTSRYQFSAIEGPLETEDIQGFGPPKGPVVDEDRSEDLSDDVEIYDGNDEDADFETDGGERPPLQAHILPLFSQLQTKDQLRVFQSPPEGTRLIVLATNVAETSITIPGIRYVFDSGRAKSKNYDQLTGVQSFDINWISKASASQRAGRAGRTSPGHCYRLYSSAVYERDFEEHTQPEILRMPAEGVVLQLKSMDLQNVVNFPFPTPPDRQTLARAEKVLKSLGAISEKGALTPLGREISVYPLSPRFAKMLAIGHQQDCMLHTVALVAALATPNLFTIETKSQMLQTSLGDKDDMTPTDATRAADESGEQHKESYRQAHKALSTYSSTSDALKALTALCAYAHARDKIDFCREMFLSYKAVAEASSLFSQLYSIVKQTHPFRLSGTSSPDLSELPPPTKIQITALQQFIAAAFPDQVAILASQHPQPYSDIARKPTRAADVPYIPLFPLPGRRDVGSESKRNVIFVHPSSMLAHRSVKDMPTYIVYQHLQRAAPTQVGDASAVKEPRTRMHPLTTISGRQLANLTKGTDLLEYGKPIGKVEETELGKKRTCWVVPSLVSGEGGDLGWPLPAVKVKQVKRQGGWEVEEVIR